MAEKEAVRRGAAAQAAGDDSGIDYSDIPQLTEEQLARMVRLREVRRKVPVSVRLDPEVLDWLRGKGAGHLRRINDILTNLMEAERRGGSGKQTRGDRAELSVARFPRRQVRSRQVKPL